MPRMLILTLAACMLAACGNIVRRGIGDTEPVTTASAAKQSQPATPDISLLTHEELNQQAIALMNDKQWPAALPYLKRAATLTSDPHDELYNIACCYARMGKKEQAVELLKTARETGASNYLYFVADLDLALLKGFKPFDDFMAEFKKAYDADRKIEGEPLLIETPSLNEVRVRLPQGYDKSKRYPVVIALHEYGSNARYFAPLYDRISYKDDFIFAAIDAPYPVSAVDENPAGRWWWLFDGPDNGWMRSRAATVQLVLAARERLLKDYSIDDKNIYLLGYRQGGTAAMLVCSTEWKKFAGFISIGAHHLGDEPRIDSGFACLLCHARADEKLSFDSLTQAQEIWAKGGATVTVDELIHWQSIEADATSAIAKWLHDCIAENSEE